MDPNFRAGVVSVTLRQHAYKNFIGHTIKTGLSCIEWGSDIHVPYSEPEKAADVAAEMKLNNLITSSYGSYYRLGWLHEQNLFEKIIKVAKILGAPMIRVWGGGMSSSYLTPKMRREIIDDAIGIAKIAKKENINISLEYHPETITDSPQSAIEFIREVRNWGADNIYLYWQANPNYDFALNRQELVKILPYLSNIHVLAREINVRFALAEHKSQWKEYIKIIKSDSKKHDFLIEFTRNDSPEYFIEDAKVLVDLLENA